MYFPYLYGRRSEFLALREMLDDHRPLDALLPVIEPVKRNVADLARCVTAYARAHRRIAVVLNPGRGELAPAAELSAWQTEFLPSVHSTGVVVPTIRCGPGIARPYIDYFLDAFVGRS